MKLLLAITCAISLTASAATTESLTLTTPRGETLPVNLHLPDGQAKVPLLIMAPGGNYHKDNLIFLLTAAKATAQNIAVLRMDWAYCKRDPKSNRCTGHYSLDLKTEAEDLKTVVAFAQKHSRIDASKILLSGKSLGTLVAYSVFQQNPEAFFGLALLTPLCSGETSQGKLVSAADENYPNFVDLKKPTLILLGNHDEATYLPHLWEWLAKMSATNVDVSVVGGDHGLLINDKVAPDQSPNAENLDLATDSLVKWAKRTLL